MMKKLIAVITTAMLFSGTAFSVELLKADFAGTPGTGSGVIVIPAADAQLTVHSDVTNESFNVYGGTVSTTNWVYNAAGDGLLNVDLFTAANWGAPTRMDLGLLLAATGKTYTITNVEVVVTATNATDVGIDLWAARDAASTVRVNTPTVVIPAGTTGTFSIDTSLMHLIATDHDATWNQAGNGDLRLGFFSADGGNVDSIEIGEVRVNGIVENYVAPVADTNTLWNFNTPGDTEGWTQDANAHITGLTASNGVLTAAGISGNDPQVVNYDLVEPAEGYWDSMIIRVRQLNTNGTPQVWSPTGCAVVLGDEIISSALGGTGWEVISEAGEWITASISISSLGTNQLDFLRFDPIGSDAGIDKSFEVDYVQLTSSATPSAPTLPDASNWEFNTDGDLEGWTGNVDISGLSVSNGVLFSQAITGIDPQLNGPAVSVGSYYWTTLDVRIRQTDTNGTGIAWASTGCSVVINGAVQPALGGAGWNVVNEAGEWIVATLDISSFASGDIANLRIDPVGQAAGTNKNFEVDYIRLNNQPTPIPPQASWEFNTDGDLEGWGQGANNQITNLFVTNGVLSADGVTGNDPQLTRGALASQDFYWTTAEVRIRHLDAGGTPIPFSIAGLTAVIDGKIMQGNTWQITADGGGEWVVATIDLTQSGNGDISGIRIDPVGNAPTKNFEVDYIRFNSSLAPLVPTLAYSWEFPTLGDTEGLDGNTGVSGLTVADAVNGSERVLTCADVTSNDPQVLLPTGAAIPAGGTWNTLEIRVRQLTANPPGGVSQPWSNGGTIAIINGINLDGIPGPNVTKVDESDGWIVATVDISSLGVKDLDKFRIDVVGGDDSKNFEIDWIRAYALQAPVGYNAWTFNYGLSGGAAAGTADPDMDTFNNFYEYAFGGNPVDPMDIGLLPVASVANVGSNVLEVVSYERSDVNSGVDYSLEAMDNLVYGSWVGLTETVDYTVAGTGAVDAEMNAVTNHIPTTANVRFIQSKATAQ